MPGAGGRAGGRMCGCVIEGGRGGAKRVCCDSRSLARALSSFLSICLPLNLPAPTLTLTNTHACLLYLSGRGATVEGIRRCLKH